MVSPRMLIAQDFMFASYADCTGLDFTFSFFTFLDLPLSAGLDEICSSLKNFDSMELIFFLPEGHSEAFIRCGTLLHSAFIFQIGKHVSDAVCRVMYDYV